MFFFIFAVGDASASTNESLFDASQTLNKILKVSWVLFINFVKLFTFEVLTTGSNFSDITKF